LLGTHGAAVIPDLRSAAEQKQRPKNDLSDSVFPFLLVQQTLKGFEPKSQTPKQPRDKLAYSLQTAIFIKVLEEPRTAAS